jgi:hypothetical protein
MRKRENSRLLATEQSGPSERVSWFGSKLSALEALMVAICRRFFKIGNVQWSFSRA